MMKQLFTFKTKCLKTWLVAVSLLMALPMAGQNANFKVGDLWYQVTDETNHNVTVISPQTPDQAEAYNNTLSAVVNIPQSITYSGQSWTVTEINQAAFNQVTSIKEVTLPATIRAIGNSAFRESTLETINFPEALLYIGVSAFEGSKLKKANIPGETFIASTAFKSCTELNKVTIPKVTCLGEQCFAYCTNLTSITVPVSARLQEQVSLTSVQNASSEQSGKNTFANCYNLSSVTIEDGVKSIADGMFTSCRSIKTMDLPASVEYIGIGGFSVCRSLESISMSTITTIASSAFTLCGFKGDLVIPSNVKTIGEYAFAYNDGLTGFTWKGETGCTLDAGNFSGCVNLEFIDLHTLDNPTIGNTELTRKEDGGVFGGLATHTVVYLPKNSAFTFAEGEDVNFVKADNTCTLLSVQDGADYEFPNAFKATKAVYNKYNATVTDNDYLYEDDYSLSFPTLDSDNSLSTYRDFSGISNGKNCATMLLPYEVQLPKGIRAYELHLKDNYNPPVQGEKEYTQYYLFRSIPDESVLEANKPYLLRIVDGNVHKSDEFGATNVAIAASSSIKVNDDGTEVTPTSSTSALRNVNAGTLKPQGYKAVEPNQEFFFVGGTERLNNELAINLNTWLLNTDYMGIDVWRKVHKTAPPVGDAAPTKPVTAAPFRGYIQPINNVSGNAKRFVILMEGETTGIDDLQQDKALNGAQRIYTLDGRYVGTSFDTLPNGIYVIKGKKIVK